MAGRSPTILITDDAKVYRLLMKQCLKGRGYHCLIPSPAWRGGRFLRFCASHPQQNCCCHRRCHMNAIEHGNLAIGYTQKHVHLEAGTFDDLIDTRRRTEPYVSRQVQIEYVIPTEVRT